MQNCFVIKSDYNFKKAEEEIIRTFSPELIDHICSETISKNGNVHYFLSLREKKKNTVFIDLAKCLADWIIYNYRNELFREILNSEFIELQPNDYYTILNLVQSKIDASFLQNEYDYIVKKITNHFKNNNLLNVEGFLKFGVSEYRIMLKLLLYEAVEDFFAEQEYCEFTGLLKDYIQMCNSEIDLIHIVVNRNGKFDFYDFSKKEICFDIDNDESIKELISEEDRILSILITIAPKRIIWHSQIHNKTCQIKDTIKEIFEDRFSECNGCELCNQKHRI